jgi:hypothetical protein
VSVRPHGTNRLPLDEFSWNLVFEYFFLKSIEKIQVSLISNTKNGYFTWRLIYIYDLYRSCHLKRRNVSNKSFIKTKKKTLLRFNRFFFIVSFCEMKWKKDGTAEQATDDNRAHAFCMLDTYGYKHTHRTCHIYWFSKDTQILNFMKIRLIGAEFFMWTHGGQTNEANSRFSQFCKQAYNV